MATNYDREAAVEAYRDGCEALETSLLDFLDKKESEAGAKKRMKSNHFIPDRLHNGLVACCSDTSFMTSLLSEFYASQSMANTTGRDDKVKTNEMSYLYRVDASVVQ